MASGTSRGLYARLLGPAWLQLAEPVRHAHTISAMHGSFRIAHGRGALVRMLTALLRLPRASGAAETRLVVTSDGSVERWDRRFDDRRLDTRQYQTGEGELGEQVGILEFRFRLEPLSGSLVFRQVKVAVVVGPLRLRLPAAWLPVVEAREDPAGARRIGVHVRVVIPMLGPLMTYDGTMDLEEQYE